MLKRLQGQDASLFRSWISKQEDTVIDVGGERYLIQFISKNELQEEIESDPELKQILAQADSEIADGQLYSTEDILTAIDRGEI